MSIIYDTNIGQCGRSVYQCDGNGDQLKFLYEAGINTL